MDIFAMLIKSALITQASGSLGGMTAAHNAAGTYLRARTIPVDPGSAAQQDIRSQMQAASIEWHTILTVQQRDDWAAYAANVPMIGRLGDPLYITGMAHYIRSRIPRAYFLLDHLDDAPTIFNLGTFTPITCTASQATQLISVVYDNTDAWAIIDDGALLIAQSRPLNPTINYYKGPFIQRTKVDGATATPPTSPEAFTSLYTLTEDQIFFLFVRSTEADGRLSTPQIARGIVAA